jgi:hypothetical protein
MAGWDWSELPHGNVRVYDGEFPVPISGNVVTSVTTTATDLQFDSTTVTGEVPLPISGRVELYDSITVGATNQQYGGVDGGSDVTVTREAPLPISGLVELESALSSTTQYELSSADDADITVTREAPLPISGIVTLSSATASNVNFREDDSATVNIPVTREAPLPVSGAVEIEIAQQSGENPFPISGRIELYDTPTKELEYKTSDAGTLTTTTREAPLPISGMVELETSIASDMQYGGVDAGDSVTVTRQAPLPISGLVELESSVPSTIEYNINSASTTGIPTSREAPLPISGTIEIAVEEQPGESPFPISGVVELKDGVSVAATDLQYNSTTVTAESPLPMSGIVELKDGVSVAATDLQFNSTTVTREAPLPISGRVEFYDTITVGATDLQYNSTTATREAPLPISGRVELYDSPLSVNVQYDSTAVTTGFPLPISGTIDTVGSMPDKQNSTTATLTGGANWTGVGTDLLGKSTVTCTLYADVASAADGMKFQFSMDNSNWDDTYSFNMDAGSTRRFQFPICARYFRINYTNGADAQSAFRVQTVLHTANQLSSIHRLLDEMSTDRSAQVVKTVVFAQQDASGNFTPVASDNAGAMSVAPQHTRILEHCNTTTGWTVINDDTANLTTDLNHVYGTASLEFDKVNGAGDTVFCGVQKTLDRELNANDYLTDGGGFVLWSMYFSSIAQLDYAWIRLGSDSSNYNEWRVQDDALTGAAWNNMRAPLSKPDATAGNGWDSLSVWYIAIGAAFDVQNQTLSDIYADFPLINSGLQTSADITAQVSSSVSSPNVNVLKWGATNVTTGAGASDGGTLRVNIANDNVDLDAINTNTANTETAVRGDLIASGNIQFVDQAVQGSNPLPVSGLVEVMDSVLLSANEATDIGNVGLAYDLNDTATSTPVSREAPLPISGLVQVDGVLAADMATIAGAVTGSEMQVDVLTNVATNAQWAGTEIESTDHHLPVSGIFSGPETGPIIRNVEIDASGVEYTTALPGPLYGFDIKASGFYPVYMSFQTGEILSERYITIPNGGSYGKEFMRAKAGLNIFVASDVENAADHGTVEDEDSRSVQIIAWTE